MIIVDKKTGKKKDVRLPKTFKEKWLKALRSGDFKQTESALFDGNTGGYCCLGVACRIMHPKINLINKTFITQEDFNKKLYRLKVPSLLKGTASVAQSEYNEVVDILSKMNDSARTFKQIAAWIEKKLIKMNDHIFYGFMESLKKDKSKTRGITIEPNHFEEFQIAVTGDGKLDLHYMADLYEWLKGTLKTRAHQLDFICRYHPNSPRYWLKDIDKVSNEEEQTYSVGLDLERFLDSAKKKEQSKNQTFYIPDNYELAKKVLKEFKKDPNNKKFKLSDTSFREFACWDSKSVEAVKALGNFINEKYVQPDLKIVLEENKIVNVVFTKEQVDLQYE